MNSENKLSKILSDLKSYFKNTPRAVIKSDWEELGEKWGSVGITVEEFFSEIDQEVKTIKEKE